MTARRRPRSGVIALGFIAASAVAACTILNLGDLDEYRGSGPSTPGDSGVDAGDAACVRHLPPPNVADPETGGTNLSFALDDVSWSIDGELVPGYDLDDRCTCPGPPSCRSLGVTDERICDGDGGGDNSGNELFEKAILLANSNTFSLGALVKEGRDGLLLQVSGYNERDNDGRVGVAILWTAGTNGIQDDAPERPMFDGGDRWTVDPDSIEQKLLTPKYADLDAYVSGRTFVANADRFELRLGRLKTRLARGFITGELRKHDDGLWHVDQGRIAAAVRTSDLFMYLIRSEVCPGGDDYSRVKQVLCPTRDIRAERGSEEAACDSVAVSLAFTATQIRLEPTDDAGWYQQAATRDCDGAPIDDCPE